MPTDWPTSSIRLSFCDDLTDAEAAIMALSCYKRENPKEHKSIIVGLTPEYFLYFVEEQTPEEETAIWAWFNHLVFNCFECFP